jgi:hypothetical protein
MRQNSWKLQPEMAHFRLRLEAIATETQTNSRLATTRSADEMLLEVLVHVVGSPARHYDK